MHRGTDRDVEPASSIPDGTSRRHRPDYAILVLTALLMVIGLVVVYSISPGLAAAQNVSQGYFITKQLIDVALGVVVFGLAAFWPLRRWSRLGRPLVIVAIVASLIVMFTPINEVYPAHRWIRFGNFSFQVAELIKLALIIWLAGFLTKQWRAGKLADARITLKSLIIILLVTAFIVAKLQSDLGSTGVMVAIIVTMAFSVGVPLKRLALIVAAVLGVAILAIASSDYRRERLVAYLNPSVDCKGSSYQACQALIAVGSGGLFGLGLGYSVQAYGYLPEASNDSIFAIVAEKFGFIGAGTIIVIYGLLIARLKRLIERTADQFYRLIVVGVLAWLSTQMIINIGSMLGLLPMKGITLPLISQGGTSLVFVTAALGLVFHISRYTSYNAKEPQNDATPTNDSFNRRRFGRAYNPSFTSRPRA
ncbi:cell division protein FtsW [Candidatus Saccharibacteria bacterium]|nr:cell division protein FtsW [Candidatus Saccharibacteria bacterium]